MIKKSFELKNEILKENHLFLFYGQNEGLKNQIIETIFKKKYLESIYQYEESEIIKNEEGFFNNILSKSFFENEKLIIINRVSDKIKEIAEELIEKQVEGLIVILNAKNLEKKSKIRSLFEKNKKTICVPFYEDNNQTLSSIISSFFREKKIPISQQSINLIVERCRGDRQNLKNELEKIENFMRGRGKLNLENLLKLTNLAENYNVSELVDHCLAKNKKKTANILNENNYTIEDCIIIMRTFLIKAKRLAKLCKEFQETRDFEKAITNFKPPIFWKEKDTVKKQIQSWSYKDAEDLIFQTNEIELLVKKNSANSINILSDFIIQKSSTINN
ncbi:DNA polymerase III subunit delta [Candidatus Pelagibacter sp.]|nr:DNA polymerase III subunit delta [Candidatus Pelagibacter sp.]